MLRLARVVFVLMALRPCVLREVARISLNA